MSDFAKTRERNRGGRFVVPSVASGFDKKAYYRKRYKENREEILQKVSAWAKANPEKRKAAKDRWRAKNKERTNFLTRRYIYRKKHAAGKLSFEDEKAVYAAFPNCPYCQVNKSDTLDHVTPLSRGGTNKISNLVAVCRSCNSKKGAKTLIEFNPLLYVMWNRLSV